MESGECDIYVVDLDGSGPPKRLTGEPGCETDLAWSPDGAETAFTQQSGDGSGDTDIYKMNVGGSEATRLTFSPLSEGQPAWSPDGEQISFVRHMSGIVPGYAEGPMAIYKMAYDGTDPVLLKDFEKAVARYPDWWGTLQQDDGVEQATEDEHTERAIKDWQALPTAELQAMP